MSTWLVRAALGKHHSQDQTYMVLSGGLGSSEYIQRRLQARYGTAAGTNYPNARGLQILLAADP
jgi:hypothetical protein